MLYGLLFPVGEVLDVLRRRRRPSVEGTQFETDSPSWTHYFCCVGFCLTLSDELDPTFTEHIMIKIERTQNSN